MIALHGISETAYGAAEISSLSQNRISAYNPMAPFGGYKRSGNGREYGVYGFEEYLETKAIIGFDG
ncbi:aldehyde dehydrogenase family protein [Pseudomonas sp. ACN8]|uniref:aldehyde dehydrogenase family protein n=1 Tax=Pseudomonas sp. ACN8 TaxID=1920428 RepID=UPI002115C1F8|nr:aldehyde dehydrogenase family protein [Pseudomonas sp. ACN8]